MIFITLGSQKFQFNRLLKAVDELNLKEEIFAQIGYSDYIPKNFKYKRFMERNEFSSYINKSDVIITHGGTGAIMGALKKGKKVIAVPRLSEYGEHVDDHQLQIIEEFKELNLLYSCEDMDIEKALKIVKIKDFKKYKSNTETIINSIENFIGD